MARHAGVSASSVQRIWSGNDIKPHLVRTFKLSNAPRFAEKFWDVIGLYLNPPDQALGVGLRPVIGPSHSVTSRVPAAQGKGGRGATLDTLGAPADAADPWERRGW